MNRKDISSLLLVCLVLLSGCNTSQDKKTKDMSYADPLTGAAGSSGIVRLVTLDPGHFHAALVQNKMYEQVSPQVHIYAPEGPDYLDHLNRIKGFNNREDDPTNWKWTLYTGEDYLERMISERAGNVVVISGNNRIKTDYIYQSVKAGFHVLADKPMVIEPGKFNLLEDAFTEAGKQGVLLYDIMTERYEITSILQKELSRIPKIFGELLTGSPDNPAITKQSVHHFNKIVSGSLIKRPDWFFDSKQQGDGLVDVTTHLVDLVQWECFPEQALRKSDVEILSAKRWPTLLNRDEFSAVTRMEEYPDFLQANVKDGKLEVYSNGEILYTLKGIHAKVSVVWNYQAPEGTGDTHYSIMRGSISDISIRQGKEENYIPTLYLAYRGEGQESIFEEKLSEAIASLDYQGLCIVKQGEKEWIIQIPEKYRNGHEAHFGQVMDKYLEFLADGRLPEWEVPNMIVKYYTTTSALKMAR